MTGLPKVSGPVNFAQAITSFCAVLAVLWGAYYWVFEKDQQGKDAARQYVETQSQFTSLNKKIDDNETARTKAQTEAAAAATAQIAALNASVSKVDGKIDAYGVTTQATAARLDRVSDKLDRVVDDQKSDRQERLAYQQQNNDHVNAVDGRLRVVECLRPGGKCQ